MRQAVQVNQMLDTSPGAIAPSVAAAQRPNAAGWETGRQSANRHRDEPGKRPPSKQSNRSRTKRNFTLFPLSQCARTQHWPSMAVTDRAEAAWTPNTLPVRRWQARQWHIEMRTGSPSQLGATAAAAGSLRVNDLRRTTSAHRCSSHHGRSSIERTMRQALGIGRDPVREHQDDDAAVVMEYLLGFGILRGALGIVGFARAEASNWSNFGFFQKVSLKTASDV